jgi:trigger factor
MGAVKTQVTEKGDNKVELAVTVEAEELAKGVERALRQMGQRVRMPGFRPGKVPTPLLLGQFGFPAALQQTLESELPVWYGRAVEEAGISPVAAPEVNLGDLPDDEGGELTFSATITVRPKAALPDLKKLKVPKAVPVVPDEQLDRQLERLRQTFATLQPVEGRVAEPGDHVTIDYQGTLDGEAFSGGSGTDTTIELGTGTASGSPSPTTTARATWRGGRRSSP